MRLSQMIDSRPEWVEPVSLPVDSSWQELDRNPLVAAILYRRGFQTSTAVAEFLQPGLQPPPVPTKLPNMETATSRIAKAVRDRETIGIFGDYDVDGITSTAILTLALGASLGAERVIARLPDRAEGYGLNAAAIDAFHGEGVSLVIAVDCGSGDHAMAERIDQLGMDLIVADHHHMDDTDPATAITVSPQLNADGTYHDLTAAGVAYLLVLALAERGVTIAGEPDNDPECYLDLVALGTVADVAPLIGVNRFLVARGVERIRRKPRPGVRALLDIAQIDPASVNASDMAFALSPRINSAGRISSPRLAFDLLMSTNIDQARRLAAALEQMNIQRKMRSAQVFTEACAEITRRPDWQTQAIYAVHHQGWESGLVGAVASRIAEEVRRPVILFHERDGVLSGSARSVEGFNLVTSLAAARSLLIRYGGHSLAAGVSLARENLGQLESHLAEAVRSSEITIPAPRLLRIDATLPPNYLTLDTVRELARMEPFGRGNEQPVLRIKDAQLQKYSAMGQDRSHLKIIAKLGSRQVEAVFWGAAWRSSEMVGRRTIDLAGTLEINRWNGQERLQMKLVDFHAS